MYIVLELQTFSENQVNSLVYSFENQKDAEEKYYLILAAAVKSGLPCHSAILLNNRGNQLKSQAYLEDKILDDGVEE